MCGQTGRRAETCSGASGTGARERPRGRDGAVPGRVDISERPAIVEKKIPICARVGGAIISLVDQATQSRFFNRVEEKSPRLSALQ